jgi:hypothetical protein
LTVCFADDDDSKPDLFVLPRLRRRARAGAKMSAHLFDDPQFEQQTVIRIARHEHYVVLDRATVQDARLSWAARGLLAYLLSLPADWTIRVAHLQQQGGVGRDALRGILRELQSFGYLSGFGKGEQRNGGKIDHELRVYESPRLNPYFLSAAAPTPENPASAQPTPDLPTPEKPSPYKRDSLQTKEETKTETHTHPLRVVPSHVMAEAHASTQGGVGVSKSKFPDEVRERYAANNRDSRGVLLGAGWLTKSEDGCYDRRIEQWLEQQKLFAGTSAPPRRDVSACPDCCGSGMWYPSGFDKGVAKCLHPRLAGGAQDLRPAEATA